MTSPNPSRRLVAAFVALACSSATLAGATAPTGECKRLAVSNAADSKPGDGTRRASFSAAAVEDLAFRVRLPGATSGEHSLTLEVFMPGGFRYQTLVAAFERGAPRGKQRRLDGFPFPLDVQRAEPLPGGSDAGKLEVVVQLPVAGTAIVNSSLYGDWTAIAYLDGAEAPCIEPLVFQITQ